jgi:hypothetical protein
MKPESIFYEWELGEFIPEWAHQQIEMGPKYISHETKAVQVPLAKLVGTYHDKYSGSTWLQALGKFKRKGYDATLVRTINYEVLNKLHLLKPSGIRTDAVTVVYIEDLDKYYIIDGNHRLILVKLRGDESVLIDNVQIARLKPAPTPTPEIEPRVPVEPTAFDSFFSNVLAGVARLFGIR